MLQKLKARHRELARVLVAGATVKQAATRFGMSEEGVRAIVRSTLFQQLYGELSCEADEQAINVKKQLQELLPDAAGVLRTALSAKDIDESLRVKVAWDILDRGGLVATKEIHLETSTAEQFSDVEIADQIKELDAKLKFLAGEGEVSEDRAQSEATERPAVSLDTTSKAAELH